MCVPACKGEGGVAIRSLNGRPRSSHLFITGCGGMSRVMIRD